MAAPTTLKSSRLLIRVGDGLSPEVFTAPCALTSKSFNMSAETNDFAIPDCDDPDAPVWTARAKSTISATISGSGLLAKEFQATYQALFEDTDPRNLQIVFDHDTSPVTYSGQFLMSALNFGAEQGGFVTVEMTLVSSGAVTAS